jgi:hypothetical protein
MKKSLSTKKYFIISIVIFVVLLLATILVLVLISKEKEKVKSISSELSIANKEDVVALKRAIRKYEDSADFVENSLVDKEDVFLFISDIEQMAKKSGSVFAVQNIDLFDVVKNKELVRSTGQENPDRTHGKFVMSIRADGNWEEVSTFLLMVENVPKHTEIESFRLSSIFDSETKAQSWSANLNLITTTN